MLTDLHFKGISRGETTENVAILSLRGPSCFERSMIYQSKSKKDRFISSSQEAELLGVISFKSPCVIRLNS